VGKWRDAELALLDTRRFDIVWFLLRLVLLTDALIVVLPGVYLLL
jgi:hypothetical protein